MAKIYTREIYSVGQSTGKRKDYVGYAKFEAGTDKLLGTQGGYGPKRNQNNPKNGKSYVQNVTNMAAAKGKKRNPMMY